jgi:tetratricopeptide (TPR) repeat protein
VALATFLADPLSAGEARLNKVSPTLMEITGGSGTNAWRIPFGTRPALQLKTLLVNLPDDRAWFSHAGWLRLLDTKKGAAIGRWHFPGEITDLAPAGNRVEVTVEINEGTKRLYHYKVMFDSHAPQIHFYQTGYLFLVRTPNYEAGTGDRPWGPGVSLTAEVAREAIPELEEALRRDPTASRRFHLAWTLKAAGDRRAAQMFLEAARTPGADFTELLPLSDTLERSGEVEAAREAFELGYRDFWQKGNDPRLVLALIARLVLYNTSWEWDKFTPEHRMELVERLYRLAPNVEAAPFGWRLHADYFEKNGPPETARLWRARELDARDGTGLFFHPEVLLAADMGILAVVGAVLAGLLYVVVLFRRYRPQRAFNVAARKRQPDTPRVMHFFGLEYWSRADRLGFLLIALTGWYAAGIVSVGTTGLLRFAAAPLGTANGSYAGPATKAYFERLPATPERDLLLAIAHQHSREPADAERLYRSVPQFAEAWNNLGVILKQAGKEPEARQAFEHSLQLNPNLAEAAYNLGRGTPSLWTELHEKYLPSQPMVAPPQHGRIVRAFLGGSPTGLLFNALAGPFGGRFREWRLAELFDVGPARTPTIVLAALLTLAVVGALSLVFLVPVREVSQAPGRGHIAWQVLFPGTAPVWRFFGGLVLVAWCYFFWQAVLLAWKGTPRLIGFLGMPNLKINFGVPGPWSDEVMKELVNPGWTWMAAAPLILFVVNFFLVWRARQRA